MKKTIIFLFLTTSALFAANHKGCIETKLNEVKSIYACPHATFEVTFEIDMHTKKRSQKDEPILKIIAEAKAPITQYITNKQN